MLDLTVTFSSRGLSKGTLRGNSKGTLRGSLRGTSRGTVGGISRATSMGKIRETSHKEFMGDFQWTFTCTNITNIFAGIFQSIPLRNVLWPNPKVCRDPEYPQFYVNVGSYYKQIWDVIMNDDYTSDSEECQLSNGVDVEETANIIKYVLALRGPDYLENVFGPKASNNMMQLGGVDKVARALHGKLQFINIETV